MEALMTAGVTASQVCYEAGGHQLLSSVSLAVKPGQIAAIVGPSGSGKSTLLKVLCGIRKPHSGSVQLLGGDPADAVGKSQLIGYVPQDDIVHRSLRVEDVLRYAAQLRLSTLSKQDLEQRIEEVLRLVALHERRRVRVRRLSGGQRKRVSIGVELLAQPKVLFLDEPTSGLDPGLEKQFMSTLRQLAQPPRLVVVTTHVMDSMNVVDLLLVIVAGHLAYAGPPMGALEFFRVQRLQQLFEVLAKRQPKAWSQAFQRVRQQYALTAAKSPQSPAPPNNSDQVTSAQPSSAQPSPAVSPASPDKAQAKSTSPSIEQQLATLKNQLGDKSS